jgi:glycosyltransferase involved in cell wall biosynthesis
LLRLGSRPIEVIYNPVDTDFFSPRPEVEEDKGLIVYVGTLCKKKGVQQLIQAIPKVLRAAPGTRLWLVGRDWKDPETGKSYMSYLHTLIPADLRDRIIFKGPVEHDEVPNVLAQAWICVFPSLMEAHPVVWIEALSMGKATVASETGPGPEVIQDGVSGLLCNPYDPDSIAEKILRLLWNEELREQIKKEARRQAVERFSISSIIEQNESFYQRCIQQWSNNFR